ILLLLDLLLAAVRVSMLNTRLPYLISLRPQSPNRVERTMALLEKPRLRTSLRLGLTMLHFMLLGVGIWIFSLLVGDGPSFAAGLGLLMVAALLLLALEFALEGAILPRAERWALRFS